MQNKLQCKLQCKLIADTRERNVLRHSAEFADITYEVAQITTGDYVVVTPANTILAVLERKSLEDYAASFKDGRHDNVEKLLRMRAETAAAGNACALFYIVEGPAYPRADQYFGNIAYGNIESSMFHLAMRGINIIHTRDTLHTAQVLARFTRSMSTWMARGGASMQVDATTPKAGGDESASDHADARADVPANEQAAPDSANSPDGALAGQQTADQLRAQLTRQTVKSTLEIARAVWAVIPGITVTSADDYAAYWSLADIICGVHISAPTNASSRANTPALATIKLSTGRAPNKRVQTALRTAVTDAAMHAKMLSRVPGVSLAVAQYLVGQHTLRALLALSPDTLAFYSTRPCGTPGDKPKKLGPVCAKRILEVFAFKAAHA